MRASEFIKEEHVEELIDLDRAAAMSYSIAEFIDKLIFVYLREARDSVESVILLFKRLADDDNMTPQEQAQIKEQILDVCRLIAVKIIGKLLSVKAVSGKILSAAGFAPLINTPIAGTVKDVADRNITSKISKWLKDKLNIDITEKIFNTLKTSAGKEYDKTRKVDFDAPDDELDQKVKNLYRQQQGGMV